MSKARIAAILLLAATGAYIVARFASARKKLQLSPNLPPVPPPPSGRQPGGKVLGIAPSIVEIARKWAAVRGLPLEWVLTVIQNESGGKPGAHNVGEDSRGLMQIRVASHTSTLAKLGVGADELYDPEKNILVGTYIMRSYYDTIVRTLAGRTPPLDMGALVRLAYVGGIGRMVKTLENGGDPRVSWNTANKTYTAWGETLARVQALV